MKERNFALILFAGVALLVASCGNEKEITVGGLEKNEVAFNLSAAQTRSVAKGSVISPERIASLEMDNGETFYLEETVESLNEGIVTRGTPAFTENVAALYGSFSAVANPGTDKALEDAKFTANAEVDGLWTHRYGRDVWANAPLTFYMRMPSEPAGVTSSYTYNADGSIEFDYTSPTTAAGQQDILFTSTTMQSESDNGKTVVFYHALTGVKFANFYTNTGITGAAAITKTIIKEVTLSGNSGKGGFKNSGHCKVANDGTVTWSNLDGNTSFNVVAGSAPNDVTNYEGSNYGLDELLKPSTAARNVNDEDGTLTLWIVPQAFQDGAVTITVKYDIVLVNGDNTTTTVNDATITVSLGNKTWSAGDLHTYTLKPVHPSVELEDKMSEDKFVKSNVRVENTGNVFEYVRVNMIGNWVGKVQTAEGVYEDEDVILMGFTTSDPTNTTEVEFWNDKDNKTHYGTFTNLVQKSTAIPAQAVSPYTINNWVRYDKYYYYTLPIGPNDAITDQLFSSYEVGPSPEFWIVDKWGVRRKAKDVHLVIDMMVQAIPAPVDNNGNILDNTDNQGYIRAWVKALDKTGPNDLLDL